MTDNNAHGLDRDELEEPEPITNLRELAVGDKLRVDDRVKPLTVVDMGTRVTRDERINKEITTPLARLEGDWEGAATIVLGHRINRTPYYDEENDQYLQELGEMDVIIEGDLGREVDIERTHRVDDGFDGDGDGEAAAEEVFA